MLGYPLQGIVSLDVSSKTKARFVLGYSRAFFCTFFMETRLEFDIDFDVSTAVFIRGFSKSQAKQLVDAVYWLDYFCLHRV